MRASLFAAALGLTLVASCAKIFGVDNGGIETDGGVGQPCDTTSNNQTPCAPGLVCLPSMSYGQGNVCAAQCTADSQCPPGQGCLAVSQNGMGSGSFVLACAPNTSCNNGACNNGGTSCSNGMCRNNCFTGTMGTNGAPGCPSDETCVPMCPMCNQGVCAPTGGSGSGGEGGTDGGSSFAPIPEPLTEMACAAGMDGKIYLFGGLAASHVPTKATYVYDPVANSWTSSTPMSVARHGAGVGLGQSSGIFYVVGGFDATGGAVAANEMYNAFSGSGGSWMPQPPMPTALGGSAVEGIGMFLVAGGAAGIATPPVATVQSFTPSGQWNSQMPPPLPLPRKWMAAGQSTGGGMLAIGGFDGSGRVFPDVDRFDGTTWSSVATMPTARGKLAATTGPNQLVYVVGGNDGSKVLATVEAYQSNNNHWEMLAPMPTPREGLCLAWVNGMGSGRLYAIGGDDGMGAMPNALTTVEAFDLGSSTWIR